MGNKNTCLFYKSANAPVDITDGSLNSILGPNSSNILNFNTNTDQLTSSSIPTPQANSPLTLNYNVISEVLANTAQEAVTKSPGKNPVLTEAENNSTVPDVNLDGVMGRDGGKGSKGSTEGIHPGLIGGGVALVGGGLLIAYLEAQKAKRRRQKERMRNMNTNITNA